jgi:hypothetical protein
VSNLLSTWDAPRKWNVATRSCPVRPQARQPAIFEPGASRSRALHPRFEPLRAQPSLPRKFRLASVVSAAQP